VFRTVTAGGTYSYHWDLRVKGIGLVGH